MGLVFPRVAPAERARRKCRQTTPRHRVASEKLYVAASHLGGNDSKPHSLVGKQAIRQSGQDRTHRQYKQYFRAICGPVALEELTGRTRLFTRKSGIGCLPAEEPIVGVLESHLEPDATLDGTKDQRPCRNSGHRQTSESGLSCARMTDFHSVGDNLGRRTGSPSYARDRSPSYALN